MPSPRSLLAALVLALAIAAPAVALAGDPAQPLGTATHGDPLHALPDALVVEAVEEVGAHGHRGHGADQRHHDRDQRDRGEDQAGGERERAPAARAHAVSTASAPGLST